VRCAIAVWNFGEEGVLLTDLVDEFADMGYDGVSFLPGQIAKLGDEAVHALRDRLDSRELFATVHGKSHDTRDTIHRVLDALEDRIVAMTFDGAMTMTSLGHTHDVATMAAVLRHVEELSRGTDLQFGIEDFPLDDVALDHGRDELGPLLECPRYGMLVDIGHLNIRRKSGQYFGRVSESEYVANCARRIIEVHVHDNDGRRDLHAPLGDGTTDFAAVAAGLRAVGFDGISTIEICPAFHDATPDEDKPKAERGLAEWRGVMG